MSNPLMEQRQDSTQSFSGVRIAESVDETKKAVENGDWAGAVMGSVTTALDGISTVMDPLGELIAAGVGWLMEHVGPVSDALDELTGDADQIKAHAKTWQNIADELGEARTDMKNLVDKDLGAWTGKAADAYRSRTDDSAKLLEAAQKAAEGASNGTNQAGEVVAAVRTLVRDLLSDLAGHLVSWGLQIAATVGIGLTWVLPQIEAKVAEIASKIAQATTKLVRALGKLSPMLRKLGDSFGEAADALKRIKKGGNSKGGHDTTSPDSHKGGPDKGGPDKGTDHPPPNKEKDSPDSTSSQSKDGSPPPNDKKKSDNSGGNRDRDGGNANIRQNSNGSPNESQSAKNKNTCGDPIDVASGDVVLEQTDVELAGALPLVLDRVHVSSYRVGRHFGPSWSSTLDQRLEVEEKGVWFAADDGTLLSYTRPGPRSSVMPVAGPRRELSRDHDGHYTVTDADQDRTLHFGAGEGALPLLAITDRNGNRIDVDRDADGTPTEVRHGGGYRIRVESEDALVTALQLRAADNGEDLLLVRYEYEDGHLARVINASGLPLRFTYDHSGRLTSWTDRNGAWYSYHYDHTGRVVRAEGSGGFLSGSLEYDDANHVTHWTNSLGHSSEFHLNELGQTVREVDPAGNEVRSEWDAYDRLLARTDELGHRWRYDYDEHGNLTAATRPDGSQALTEYNELHLPVTVVAPDGTITRNEYDGRGNLTRLVDPAGTATTYGYDERGHLATVTDALGVTQHVRTDAAGLPVTITDGGGGTTRCERDGFGRVTTVIDSADRVTRLGWTTDGNPAWREQPDGALERWDYDDEGNEHTHIDPSGRTSRTELTHFDLPAVEIRPDGTRLTFDYDTELRLTSVTNEQGLVWHYAYDEVGDLVSETDFNGRTITYRNDAAGQLVERTNGAGETTTFSRNALGDVIERRTPDGTTTYRYDEGGQLVQAINEDAHIAFQHDPLGRTTAETINGRTVTSTYDALGRRVRRRTPSGAESVWEYGAWDQPTALHTAGRTLRFEHDPAGRETRRRLGPAAALSQDWDDTNQLTRQTLHTAAGHRLAQRSYSYRADGFLTGIDDQLTGPRRFDLDRGGQVTGVQGHGWGERYAYDAAGNVVDASWPTGQSAPTAESLGQREYSGTLIQRAGNVTYKHDAQGRIVLCQRKRLSHKPETWRYFWDADDRLVGVLTPDGTNWRYRYDPLGRRTSKQRLGPDGTHVVEQVEFTWDGAALAEQARTDDGQLSVTVWDYEPGTFRPLTQTERSPLRDAPQQWIDRKFHAVLTDLVGTPTELVNDHGGIDWFHRTTLWGTTSTRGGTAYTPLRFPGQYHDPETDLHYNLHRHYDPTTGHYASADPLGLAAGPNPHRYVANPHELIDPLGLHGCDKIKEQVRHVRKWGDVIYRRPDKHGRPTGIFGRLKPNMLQTGSEAKQSIHPPGYEKGKGLARGHLWGRQLGGSGKEPRNLATLFQNPTNHPDMSKYEGKVAAALRRDESLHYRATPVYDGTKPMPKAVTMKADGSGSANFHATIMNKPK